MAFSKAGLLPLATSLNSWLNCFLNPLLALFVIARSPPPFYLPSLNIGYKLLFTNNLDLRLIIRKGGGRRSNLTRSVILNAVKDLNEIASLPLDSARGRSQ